MSPLKVIAALAVAIVLAGLIGFALFTWQETTVEPALQPAASTAKPDISKPSAKVSDEPDLSTTRKLNAEEVAPYYEALQARAENYRTAHVRTRLEFPLLRKGEVLETEFWFDARKPDCFINKVITSQPEDRRSRSPKFVVKPIATESVISGRMIVVSFARNNVHEILLDATDEASQPLVSSMLIKNASQMENPLRDLLFGVSYEDRLKEFSEAALERKSDGNEVQLLHRINSRMRRAIQKSQFSVYLPVDEEGLAYIALRRDFFDEKSRALKKTIYYTAEWVPFLVQTYPEIEWDAEMPDSRFEPDVPEGATPHNLNDNLRRKSELGIRADDFHSMMAPDRPLSETDFEEVIRQRQSELNRPETSFNRNSSQAGNRRERSETDFR